MRLKDLFIMIRMHSAPALEVIFAWLIVYAAEFV